MPGRAAKVIITERQQEVLQTLTRSSTCPQALAQRAHMILLAFGGWDNQAIADHLGCERHAVGIWRRRWAAAFQRLVLIECCEKAAALPRALEELLSDLPRPGCPGKFTAEQIAQLLAVACEPPADSGRSVTHWTPTELADEVQQRGIVASISPRHVGRFLKDGPAAAASQPLLAECPARRPGGVPAAGGRRLRLLPRSPALVGGGRDPHRQRR
jgi:putative transposase